VTTARTHCPTRLNALAPDFQAHRGNDARHGPEADALEPTPPAGGLRVVWSDNHGTAATGYAFVVDELPPDACRQDANRERDYARHYGGAASSA
jgi:hypothetical protein